MDIDFSSAFKNQPLNVNVSSTAPAAADVFTSHLADAAKLISEGSKNVTNTVKEGLDSAQKFSECLNGGVLSCIGKLVWEQSIKPIFTEFLANGIYNFSNFAVTTVARGALDYMAKPLIASVDDKLAQTAQYCSLPQPELYAKTAYVYHLLGDKISSIDDFTTSFIVPEAKSSFKASHLIIPATLSMLSAKYSYQYYAKAIKGAIQLLPFVGGHEIAIGTISTPDIEMGITDFKIKPPFKEQLLDVLSDASIGSILGLISFCTNSGIRNALIETGVTPENASYMVLGANVALVATPILAKKISQLIKDPPDLPSLIKSRLLREPQAVNPNGVPGQVEVFWDTILQKYIVRPKVPIVEDVRQQPQESKKQPQPAKPTWRSMYRNIA